MEEDDITSFIKSENDSEENVTIKEEDIIVKEEFFEDEINFVEKEEVQKLKTSQVYTNFRGETRFSLEDVSGNMVIKEVVFDEASNLKVGNTDIENSDDQNALETSQEVLIQNCSAEKELKTEVNFKETCKLDSYESEKIPMENKFFLTTIEDESLNLNKHDKSGSSGTIKKLFKCTHCSYQTYRKSCLTVHLRKHNGPFQCSYCPYQASEKEILNIHLMTHTGEEPYKCSYCPFMASMKRSLNIHLKKHTGEKPFKCNFCEYQAFYRVNLDMHLKTHDEAFKCNCCSYQTYCKKNLDAHTKIHIDEKPFKCTLCTYEASRKYKLKEHLMTHSGEKPFKCSHCPFQASWKYKLKNHLRIHTGEKPYKCLYCIYQASHKMVLKKHLRVHHAGKTINYGMNVPNLVISNPSTIATISSLKNDPVCYVALPVYPMHNSILSQSD